MSRTAVNLRAWRPVAAIGLAALALAACGTLRGKAAPPAPVAVAPVPPPPAPAPPIVRIVPAPAKPSCVPRSFPHAPKYPDTDAALLEAGGAADRYQLMAAGRLLRSRRLAELEKLVDACR